MTRNMYLILLVMTLTLLAGCKPDRLEIELYLSDFEIAATKKAVEVPVTAMFSMMGDDDEGLLPKATAMAKKYLGKNAEFKFSKGAWGDELVVKFNAPMGTAKTLDTYLDKHNCPVAVTIDGDKVMFGGTKHLESLSKEIASIHMMLDVKLPSSNTIFRLIGDKSEKAEITAIAVFVDKRPELIFKKQIARRETVEINFKGGDASVYSELPPMFTVKY